MRTQGSRPNGTVRYTSIFGTEVAYPGTIWYGSLLMVAQEVWNNDTKEWLKISGVKDGKAAW